MIPLILFFIAGIANAFMDTIAHKGGGILPRNKWWTMKDSWKNKWKNGDPKQGERFFLSSTALVFVTDAWHFFQMIMLSCFALAISLNLLAIQNQMFYIESNLLFVFLAFIIFKISFSLGFTIFWKLLNKKQNVKS